MTYDGGVIIGADSRTTMGSLVANRITDKIEPVHKRIYCLRSGAAAHTQTIARYVRYYIEMHAVELGQLPQVSTAAHLFRNFLYTYKDQLNASIIVAGWDEQNGGQVFQLPLGGTLLKLDCAAGGSGSTFIHGFIDDQFRKNMSRGECKEFVKKAVSLAMFRDGSSGGCVRLADINAEGVTKEFFPFEKLPIH